LQSFSWVGTSSSTNAILCTRHAIVNTCVLLHKVAEPERLGTAFYSPVEQLSIFPYVNH
jgi:hypothetical protein